MAPPPWSMPACIRSPSGQSPAHALLAAGPFLRTVQRRYRLHALAFIVSITADGFRWRMYLSVVATDAWPSWA